MAKRPTRAERKAWPKHDFEYPARGVMACKRCRLKRVDAGRDISRQLYRWTTITGDVVGDSWSTIPVGCVEAPS